MKKLHLSTLILPFMAMSAISCTDTVGEELRQSMEGSDYITFEAICDWKGMAGTERAADTGENVAKEATGSRSGDDDYADNSTLIDVIPVLKGEGTDSLYVYVYEMDMDDQAISSRGTLTTDATEIEEYSISGYKFAATESWGNDCYPNFTYNEIRKNTWDVWANPNVLEWPGSDFNVRFFATYPIDAITYPADKGGTPLVTYTIPTEVENQIDILTADTGVLPGNHRKTVPLKFRHAFSTVEVYADSTFISGAYTNLKIDSVYCTGTYNFESNTWSNLKGKSSIEESRTIKVRGGDKVITDGNYAVFIIPQTLPADAALSFSFLDSVSGDEKYARDITIPLSGNWQSGKKYRYVLTSKTREYYPALNVKSRTIPSAAGGKGYLTLESICDYKERKNGYVSFGYKACSVDIMDLRVYNPETGNYDISYQYNNLPSDFWIKNIIVSESDASGRFTINYEVEPNTASSNIDLKAATLRGTPAKGSGASPWNLANSSGAAAVENTANSYIINGPGTYSIPLVYGNAIKNGSYNTNLHISGLSGCTIDHLNSNAGCPYGEMHPYPYAGCVTADGRYDVIQVSKPYIYDFAPAGMSVAQYIDGAKLIWQDQPGLIKNLRLGSDHKTIVFDVPSSTIKQGNALISVTSRGKVLWSWHIWVTDYQLSSSNVVAVKNALGSVRNILPVNLGWVDESYGIFERSARLYFSQHDTGKIYYVSLSQNGSSTVTESGYAPLWQWGCPIPRMRHQIAYYDIDGNRVWQKYQALPDNHTTRDFIVNVYANPDVYFTGEKFCGKFMNYWHWRGNASEVNDNTVSKSMYDPCPVGTSVPNSATFTSFTISGKNVTQYTSVNNLIEQLNVSDKAFGPYPDFRFAHFYSYPNRTSTLVTIPLDGMSDCSSDGQLFYGSGLYWTVTPTSSGGSYCLYMDSYYDDTTGAMVLVATSYNRGFGGSIRPMYGNSQ